MHMHDEIKGADGIMKKTMATLLVILVLVMAMAAPVLAVEDKAPLAEKWEELKEIQTDTRADMLVLNGLHASIRTAMAEARTEAGWVALTEEEKADIKAFLAAQKNLAEDAAELVAELKKGWADVDKDKFQEKVAEIKADLAAIRELRQGLREEYADVLARMASNREANAALKPLMQEIAALQAELRTLAKAGQEIMAEFQTLMVRLKEARAAGQQEKMQSLMDKLIEQAQAYNENVNARIACLQEILEVLGD
jgi:predicted transcriptional regulator